MAAEPRLPPARTVPPAVRLLHRATYLWAVVVVLVQCIGLPDVASINIQAVVPTVHVAERMSGNASSCATT